MTEQEISDIAHGYIDELEWCPMHMADDAPFDSNGVDVDDVAEICANIDEAFGLHTDVTQWAYYPNSIRDLCDLYLGRERSVDPWQGVEVKCEHITESMVQPWWKKIFRRLCR